MVMIILISSWTHNGKKKCQQTAVEPRPQYSCTKHCQSLQIW